MPRKRVTQIFPWLLPLRIKQRLFCFYTGMRLDGNQYADGDISYKDGLTMVDGKLTTAPGGGMCQMSNLLFCVNQKTISVATRACVSEKLLYRNKCEIGYSLPEGTEVMEKGSKEP